MKANCMICGFEVAVLQCHYKCNNCGFAANWDEGSDNQLDYSENTIANKEPVWVDYEEI